MTLSLAEFNTKGGDATTPGETPPAWEHRSRMAYEGSAWITLSVAVAVAIVGVESAIGVASRMHFSG